MVINKFPITDVIITVPTIQCCLNSTITCKRYHHQVKINPSLHLLDYTLYGYGQSNVFVMIVL